MSESRVTLTDGSNFQPREWLRREVLWASLVIPYPELLKSWLTGAGELEFQYYSATLSRRDEYARTDDAEYQSLAFFNQSKAVATLAASAILFKVCMSNSQEWAIPSLLGIQANIVDRIIGLSAVAKTELPDRNVFETCGRVATEVATEPAGFSTTHQWLYASKQMRELAAAQAHDWIASSLQNPEGTLPELTINNGGHPRSGGPRVDTQQTIFHKIVASEAFLSLASS